MIALFDAARHPQPPLRPVTHACRHRPEARRNACASCSTGRRTPKPRVVDLLFHLPVGVIDRAQQPGIALAAEGADRHAEGAHRPPPAAAARQQAHPVSRVRPRRHRRDRPHLLPREGRLAREDAAGRRDALRQRRGRVVQRPADDGPSRPHRRRGRFRQPAADRAGLSDDRRPLARRRFARAVGEALAERAGAARMARRAHSRPRRDWPPFAAALARAHHPESPTDVRRRRACTSPASPTTSCWRASWRCR